MRDGMADVVVFSAIPMVLSYRIPAGISPAVGTRVQVPVRTSRRVGVVIALHPGEADGLKDILAVIDAEPLVSPEIVDLLLWCARYYHAGIGACLALAFPPLLRKGDRIELEEELRVFRTAAAGRLGSRQLAVWEAVPPTGVGLKELQARFKGHAGTIRALINRGFLELRAPADAPVTPGPMQYSQEQAGAIETIAAAMHKAKFRTIVLHGITGSGKTAVYLACALQALTAGRSVIYLVPEIALTPQTIARIRERIPFATAVFHSGLSPKARAQEFLKVSSGRARFVLGTRSAIFAPVTDLGLIVVDEEHDGSYKQSDGVTYNARDLAIMRAKHHDAVVILGSATPSLDTYIRVERDAAALITMHARYGAAKLPTIAVIDMRARKETLSAELVSAMEETLAKGEQSLLFINRRGFSAAMVCPGCGKVLGCKRCARSLTYHKARARAVCHYCGYVFPVPEICPECGCMDMRPLGLGTERIIEEVRAALPQAKVLQMDSDEVSTPAKLSAALAAIRERRVNVIVGTQMISKGHDFPYLTLVGVVHAEQQLYMPDFRAVERTFQQVVQVAGRAGRTRPDTRVLIQTVLPEHPVIEAIARYDYHAMRQVEIEGRKAAGFAPYAYMARCVFTSAKAEAVQETARLAAKSAAVQGVRVLGPAPAPLALLRAAYRWHIILTADKRAALHKALDRIEKLKAPAQVRLKIDVDPYDML